MPAKDELLTIAQIAVALIGFSGLIFVFRARDVTELAVRDLSALAMIVVSGAITLAFALLPLPIWYLGLSEPTFWRLCSGVFGATLLAAGATFLAVNWRLTRSGHPERAPRLNRVTFVLALLASAVLTLSAVGLLPPNPAIYLTVLILCMLLCLSYVALMIAIARRFPRR